MQKARRHSISQAPTACKRTVSGSFHSLSQGSFHLSFTVLVHYRSFGSIQPYQMVLVYSDRVSPAPPYSIHYDSLRLQDFHPLRSNFPVTFYSLYHNLMGFSAFARHYSRNNYCFLFLQVLRCFSSPGCLLISEMLYLQYSGFPHSDIYGSTLVCSSPQLFAAYHVLRSLQKPRHPPYALSCFLFIFYFLKLFKNPLLSHLQAIHPQYFGFFSIHS